MSDTIKSIFIVGTACLISLVLVKCFTWGMIYAGEWLWKVIETCSHF